MAVTHHQQIAISGTVQFSGPVIATGSGKQSSLTKLAVSGTARVSGLFSASAAGKQTSLTKLNVSGTSALSGHTTLPGLVITSAANSYCGKRYIGTAQMLPASIASNKVKTTSRIILTPQVIGTPVGGPKAWVSSITSGSAFGVKLGYGATPTGMTGTLHWMIVNAT